MENLTFDYIRQSIRKIINFFLKIQARKNRLQGKRLLRIVAPKSGSLKPLTLYTTNFSVRLKYSLKYKEYYTELWLRNNTNFVIKSNTSHYILNTFPSRTTLELGVSNFTSFFNWKLEKSLYQMQIDKKFPDLSFKSFCISVGKSAELNEDAYFISEKALGVADGIGGVLTDFGVSSKQFSSELMSTCKELLTSKCIQGKEAVQLALKNMQSGGSSTYLIASILKNTLKVSILGDCSLLLFRKSIGKVKIILKTAPKTYDKITPYQVSKAFSPSQLKNSKGQIRDRFKIDSDEYSVFVQEGDFVLMGSDGLFDNVFEEDIFKIVKKNFDSEEKVAEQVFQLAMEKSAGIEATPFSNRFSNEKNFWVGGKRDDITVLASKITKSFRNSL